MMKDSIPLSTITDADRWKKVCKNASHNGHVKGENWFMVRLVGKFEPCFHVAVNEAISPSKVVISKQEAAVAVEVDNFALLRAYIEQESKE